MNIYVRSISQRRAQRESVRGLDIRIARGGETSPLTAAIERNAGVHRNLACNPTTRNPPAAPRTPSWRTTRRTTNIPAVADHTCTRILATGRLTPGRQCASAIVCRDESVEIHEQQLHQDRTHFPCRCRSHVRWSMLPVCRPSHP